MRGGRALLRLALWTVRGVLAALCGFEAWLLWRVSRHGVGIAAESASGGTFSLLPVQWAAAAFLWLGGLISFQLLLMAAEIWLRGRSRGRPPLAGVSPSR
ncbi:MAG: hypothetical protein IT164_09905 [Bryobacterales bacterium]|nr:hypothetical protein [Bryobacterales bacterium]